MWVLLAHGWLGVGLETDSDFAGASGLGLGLFLVLERHIHNLIAGLQIPPLDHPAADMIIRSHILIEHVHLDRLCESVVRLELPGVPRPLGGLACPGHCLGLLFRLPDLNGAVGIHLAEGLSVSGQLSTEGGDDDRAGFVGCGLMATRL